MGPRARTGVIVAEGRPVRRSAFGRSGIAFGRSGIAFGRSGIAFGRSGIGFRRSLPRCRRRRGTNGPGRGVANRDRLVGARFVLKAGDPRCR